MQIFIISLRDSVSRRANVTKELHNVSFKFFDAVDLRSNDNHEILNLYNQNKTVFLKGYKLTKAELGCFASHYELWKKCIELDEPILIFEDNLHLQGNLGNQLANIYKLTNKFGLIKLTNTFTRKFITVDEIDTKYKLISNLKGGCGTGAYCISPSVAEKYIELCPSFFEPVDDFMENEWRTQSTIFSYYPNLVARSETASVIGSRKDKSERTLKQKIGSIVYRLYRQIRQTFYNVRKYVGIIT